MLIQNGKHKWEKASKNCSGREVQVAQAPFVFLFYKTWNNVQASNCKRNKKTFKFSNLISKLKRWLTGKISKCAGQVDSFFFPGRRVLTTRSHRTKRFLLNRALAISSVSRFLSDSSISLTSGWFLKKLTKSLPLKYSTRVSCKTAHLDSKSLWSRTFSANNWKTSFLAACFYKKEKHTYTNIRKQGKMTKQKNFTARSEINIGQQLSINPSTYRRWKEIARHRSESSLNKAIWIKS